MLEKFPFFPAGNGCLSQCLLFFSCESFVEKMTELHNGGGGSHMFHTIRFFSFFFVKEKLAAEEGIFPIPHLFINTLNAKRSQSSWEIDRIRHRSKWPTTTLLCYQSTKWLQELGICPSIWSGGIQHSQSTVWFLFPSNNLCEMEPARSKRIFLLTNAYYAIKDTYFNLFILQMMYWFDLQKPFLHIIMANTLHA